MPQRTGAVPPPRAPAPDVLPPASRVDRREVRRAARQRRRALAAELRRPRPRTLRAIPVAAAGLAALSIGVPLVLAFAPVFTVQRVEVTGATPAVASAVQQALASERGRPIALVADDAVARALAAVPAVASASVVRRPPSTLEVRVVARVAVAQQRSGGTWQEVDASRTVIASSPDRYPGLPAVTVGGDAAGRAFTTAVSAIDAVVAQGLRVVSVRATGPDDVVLRLAGGPRVQWGGAEQGAAKAEALRAALRGAARDADVVDVSSPGVVLTR